MTLPFNPTASHDYSIVPDDNQPWVTGRTGLLFVDADPGIHFAGLHIEWSRSGQPCKLPCHADLGRMHLWVVAPDSAAPIVLGNRDKEPLSFAGVLPVG